jgi:hypothetical protein
MTIEIIELGTRTFRTISASAATGEQISYEQIRSYATSREYGSFREARHECYARIADRHRNPGRNRGRQPRARFSRESIRLAAN